MTSDCPKCGGPRHRSAPYKSHPRGRPVCPSCRYAYLKQWTVEHPGYFAKAVHNYEQRKKLLRLGEASRKAPLTPHANESARPTVREASRRIASQLRPGASV